MTFTSRGRTQDYTIKKTFAIGYDVLNITGVTLKARDYESGNTTAKVLSVTFDNAELVMGVDYKVTNVYVENRAGSDVPVTVTVKILKGDYFLPSSSYQATMTINKIAYTGLTEATYRIMSSEGSYMSSSLPINNSVIDGIQITNNYSDYVTVENWGNSYFGVNTVTQIDSTDPMPIILHVVSNAYEDFDFTINLVPTDKPIPFLYVYGVPGKLTVGETSDILHADFDGDTVSYSVIPGYEEYIDIDPATGAITAKKAGTAYFIVTGSETDFYSETYQYMMITIVGGETPEYAAVEEMINALPDEITLDDKDAVEAARAAYDALSEDQKALISDETLAKLEAAEEALVSELVNESYIEDDAEEIELGNRIKVCGAADGGTGEYTFAFYYKKSSGTEWTKMTADSNGTSASFKPGKAVSYDVKAVVTDSDECSAEKIFTVSVKAPLVNKSELITTATVGEKIILKGAASGGAGGYTYAFYYKKSSRENWLEMKPAYTTKSASFKPGKAVSYDVMAVVKDADGTTAEKVYTVAVKTPVVNKTTVNAETVKVGEKIVLKGAASGGSKSYTYAFYYKKSTSENWIEMTAPYTSKSCAFKPGKAVSYDVKSIVKDSDGRTAEVIYTVNVTK